MQLQPPGTFYYCNSTFDDYHYRVPTIGVFEIRVNQNQLAEITDVASNSISRIERGSLMPALPTLIDICSALGTGADSILAVYIASDTPIRWTPLAEKLGGPDLEKQHKIEAILDCLIETI